MTRHHLLTITNLYTLLHLVQQFIDLSSVVVLSFDPGTVFFPVQLFCIPRMGSSPCVSVKTCQMIQIHDSHVRYCLNLFLAYLVVVLAVFQTVNIVARVSFNNRFITCSKVPLSIRNAVLLLVRNCETLRLKRTKLIFLFLRCSILLVRGFSI